MTNKNGIKVDPRTFKIINQSPLATTTTTSTTATESELSSDSDSSTSVNSKDNSVKVIKLDNLIQYKGGSNIQQQQQQQKPPQQDQQQQKPPQQDQQLQKPPQQDQQQQKSQQQDQQPQKSQQQDQQPQKSQQQDQQQQKSYQQDQQQQKKEQYKIDVGSYLKNNNLNNNATVILNDDNNEDINETFTEEINSETESEPDTVSEKSEKSEKPKTEGQQTQDVFDLTQNKLYQVLSALFEDSAGNNISQNIVKFCELFEKNNHTMEKILNQLVIMNSNYSNQLKIPESVQTNTKPAGPINEFRKKVEELKKEELKKKN